MTDVKISQLPAVTPPLLLADVVPAVQSGVTYKVSLNNIKTLLEENSFVPDSLVYVAVNGNDSDGNGSSLAPFATVTHAMATIITASISNPVSIMILGGAYNETALVIKDYVSLCSQGDVTLYFSGNITLDSGWTASSIKDIDFNAANFSFDTSGFSATSRKLIINNSTLTGDFTYIGNGDDQLVIGNSSTGNLDVTNLALYVNGLYINGNLNVATTGTVFGGVSQYNTIISGNAIYVSSGISSLTADIETSRIYGSITFDGSNTTAEIDVVSFQEPSVLNGATFTLINTSDGLLAGNVAVNYTPLSPSVLGNLEGIDIALGSGSSVTLSNIVFVSKNGSDTTGNGKISSPYLTVNFAMSTITGANTNNRYAIYVFPGNYTETTFGIKSHVSIVGACRQAIVMTMSAPLTLAADWGTQPSQTCLENLVLGGASGAVAFDSSTMANQSRSIFLVNVSTQASFVYKGKNDAIDLYACRINSSFSVSALSLNSFGTKYGSTFSVRNIIGSAANTVAFVVGSRITGNILVDTFNPPFSSTLTLTNTTVDSTATVTVDQSGAVLNIDADSYKPAPIITNGGLIELLSVGNGILANFTPTNYTPVDTSVTGHLEGIDAALTGGGGSIPLSNIVFVALNGNDGTGTGELSAPYLTIGNAMSSITTANSTNPFVIYVFPGIYNESAIAIKSCVSIVGSDSSSCIVNISGNLTLDTDWGTQTSTSSIKELSIFSSSINLDTSGMPSQINNLFISDSYFDGLFTYIGNGGAPASNLKINSSTFDNDFSVSGIIFETTATNYNSDFYVRNIIGAGDTTGFATGCRIGGNVLIDATNGGSLTDFYLTNTLVIESATVTVDQSTATLRTDNYTSLPSSTNGGNIVIISLSNGILANFSPTNYTPVDSSVNGHLRGIDNAFSTVSPFIWTTVTSTTQSLSVNQGYIANHASTQINFSLPSSSAVGDIIRIVGKGNGIFKISQGAGQQIFVGSASTTVGSTGSIAGTHAKDALALVCFTANTEWTMLDGPQTAGLTIV